ncbi:hypothetical protein CFC21_004911 [Triticum aestivum]|uniref:Disease resistance protein At4g27190-like leucine-rich repeats domain-containing protein n=2 Tax=Triticum aestivum TaxID=4565 RepID=A0A3B5YRU3_WHEAT|nr:uncharacterized protein LOC123103770 [Triticum aestivum]XP_044381395.1 uncharacterized protein LOC123103770 [Triticum aestivum]KAF6987252.1 hypothetical protein CFC21_004911 [Triticum aestivum]
MASSSWEKWPDHVRDKWHDDLRDIDFWFNRYHEEDDAGLKFTINPWRYWNVGAGPMASFRLAMSGMVEGICESFGPFKPVIKVDLKPTPTVDEAQGTRFMSIKYQLAVAAAEELGLLDQEYNRLKEEHDELQFYTYGCSGTGASHNLENRVRYTIVPQIVKKLSTEKYLLVVNNLRWPIVPDSFIQDCGFPPPLWTDSKWLISTTSEDVCNKSKLEDDWVIPYPTDRDVVALTLSALRESAHHILNMTHQESKEYWHHIALNCFHFAMVIFAKHSQMAAVTSDELIHHWATQGILPRMTSSEEEKETNICSSKCAYMHRVGRVILEAFEKYSLLQLPFSPANEAHEATNTAAQFLAYHALIAEGMTVGELADHKKKWIAFLDDHGCHVSREWLGPGETRGATALILRGCSHQSVILCKLGHILPKLIFLHCLDLSYTQLKTLPSSIECLINLRLLSLRGCHDLKTLSSSPTTSATDSSTNTTSYSPLSTLYKLEILDMNGVPFSHITQNVANQKSNLIYLNMSYSKISTFPPNVFRDMSNLEVLILASCSNLLQLPPSMALLSSLVTLEVTGTQIKCFPPKIFEEMQKLQSLKLIDNKKLISLTRPISRFQGIKLEGHPNLISFVLIGAPHVRCLSLRGCRKLESVEIKNLGALEELDLSGTTIKELPADIPNMPHLRRLLLLGVPSLRRFPWHRLERLPDVFFLDNCSEGNGNHSNQVSQVCVTDARFFYSFHRNALNLVRHGKFFQSFYIRVAPCITNSMQLQLQDEEIMLANKLDELLQKQLTYVDVYSRYFAEKIAIAPQIRVPLHRTKRHVDITGGQQSHNGLAYLLHITKSISVTYDTSIKSFSNLSGFDELEECELQWCHKIDTVFHNFMENLRNVHVSNLKSLVRFCSPYCFVEFSSLEHLHLENCPRLEILMTYGASALPCLKTLDIMFCYNLKKLFYSYEDQDRAYELPSLQRIRLQELPLLKHFDDNDAIITAPAWEELHVRGCWSLQRLPHLQGRQPEIVKVNCERSWWGKLQWGPLPHHNNYEPKLPPEFASFDESADMSSYLR